MKDCFSSFHGKRYFPDLIVPENAIRGVLPIEHFFRIILCNPGLCYLAHNIDKY